MPSAPASPLLALPATPSPWQTGDLLFTQIGPASNAISRATAGYRGARLNHMGMVVCNRYGCFVLEASPPKVQLRQLSHHLRRSMLRPGQARYLHARLREPHQALVPAALAFGLAQLELPYNHSYLADAPAYYCSELILDMFAHANGGMPFFAGCAMNFRDLRTGVMPMGWVLHYERLGIPIPEGEPGSNPAELSRDARLDILDVQGPISGYRRERRRQSPATK